MIKKISILFCLLVIFCTGACGCYGCGNSKIFDTHWTFNYAVLITGTEERVIPIESWTDPTSGGQVQFTTSEGITYCAPSTNIILLDKLDDYYTKIYNKENNRG